MSDKIEQIKEIVNKKFKFQERIVTKEVEYFEGKMWKSTNFKLEDTALAILEIRKILGQE